MNGKEVKDEKARLIAMISREQMDFIDKVGKDALFTTGNKLSRTEVVSAILSAVAQLPINGKDIRSEKELHEYIDRAIREKAVQKGE